MLRHIARIVPVALAATLLFTGLSCESAPAPRAEPVPTSKAEPVQPSSPEPTPGGRIVFRSNADHRTGEIYSVRPDGTDLKRITEDGGVVSAEPSWSRDGHLIVWYGGLGGRADIYLASADGSLPHALNLGGNAVSPDISPDGRRIAFVEVSGESLHVLELPDGRAVFLCGPASWPDWSPDGKQLLVTHWGSGRVGELHVVDAATAERRKLTVRGEDGICQQAQWSPDGQRIAYASNKDGTLDIWVMDAEGGSRRNLTGSWDTSDEAAPTWSPDGSRIAFDSDKEGSHDIWVMKADGSARRRVTQSSADETEPDWGPGFLSGAN